MGIKNWFKKPAAKQNKLVKTSSKFWDILSLSGSKEYKEYLEDMRKALLATDMGSECANNVLEKVKAKSNSRMSNDDMVKVLHDVLCATLSVNYEPKDTKKPLSVLIVGVNGAGKTTTIGKLAHYYKTKQKSVMLAAGDTFRAAAIEQLKIWATRTDSACIAQHPGSDSASVIYDALQSAQAKQVDVLLADTSGRLHTQANLMQELKKVKKVMQKIDVSYPHETWLIVDGTLGQNSLLQAVEFHEAIGLTGLVLTKMDGSAKGGAIFSIVQKLQLPITFIGVGESASDLLSFSPESFVKGFLSR